MQEKGTSASGLLVKWKSVSVVGVQHLRPDRLRRGVVARMERHDARHDGRRRQRLLHRWDDEYTSLSTFSTN